MTDDDDDVVYSHTDTSLKSVTDNDYQTPPRPVKTAFSKMINKLRSPGASEKPISPSAPVITNKKVKTPTQKAQIMVDDEVTILKTIHTPSTATSESKDNNTQKMLNYIQQLEKQMKENKQLQDIFKDIISQPKVLKTEN